VGQRNEPGGRRPAVVKHAATRPPADCRPWRFPAAHGRVDAMKLKSSCCKKYKRKVKGCKRCPLLAAMTTKRRKKRLKKIKKRSRKAA
jgi:hypothetical protein